MVPACVGTGILFPLPVLSECQGKLQELHRLLQSLESLHRIPSAPVIPTHQVRVCPGHSLGWVRFLCPATFSQGTTIGPAAGDRLCPFPCPCLCQTALGVSSPHAVSEVAPLDSPGLGDHRETQEGQADHSHMVHAELCQG